MADEKNGAKDSYRDKTGKFLKGHKHGLGGHPGKSHSITAAQNFLIDKPIEDWPAVGLTPAQVIVMRDIKTAMGDGDPKGKHSKLSLAASKDLKDRLCGKAKIFVDIDDTQKKLANMRPEQLRELEAQVEAAIKAEK